MYSCEAPVLALRQDDDLPRSLANRLYDELVG